MAAVVIDCPSCGNRGLARSGCPDCSGAGKRRAQLVLTVANLDTGAVSSVSLVPGALSPRLRDGRWLVELAPIVAGLRERVGAKSVYDVASPEHPFRPEMEGQELSLVLPEAWRPDLAPEIRQTMEARAIVEQTTRAWRLYLGRSRPALPVDPEARLAHLRDLADLLRIDLVVESRPREDGTLSWDIRFDLPSSGVPEQAFGDHDDLPLALAATDPILALRDISGRPGASHTRDVRPLAPSEGGQSMMDLAKIKQLIVDALALSTTTAGVSPWFMQAVWRDRSWHRALPADPQGTGGCGDRQPEPVGSETLDALEALVTVTDLGQRIDDLALGVEAGAAGQGRPARGRASNPVRGVAVPLRFRLAKFAERYGVSPTDLVDLHTGRLPDARLLSGLVPVADAGTDPVVDLLAEITRGRAESRLFIGAMAQEVPPLEYLVRLATNCGLTLDVTIEICDDPDDVWFLVNREWWAVDFRPDSCPPPIAVQPWHPSLRAAIGDRLTYLDRFVSQTIPTDPKQPLPTPSSSQTDCVAFEALPAMIRKLGGEHAGHPVIVRHDRRGRRVYCGTLPGTSATLLEDCPWPFVNPIKTAGWTLRNHKSLAPVR